MVPRHLKVIKIVNFMPYVFYHNFLNSVKNPVFMVSVYKGDNRELERSK